MSRPNKEARLQGVGGCDVFYAVRSYVRNGNQVCDIVNPDGALVHVGCTVINGQSSRIGAPPELWAGEIDPTIHPQVVALYRSLGRSPLVLCKLDNTEIQFVRESNAPAEQDDDEDTELEDASLDDVTYANDGTKVVLQADKNGGDLVFSPKRHAKMQLNNGATMRISQNGEAEDAPVLAEPYGDRDAEIVKCLTDIVDFLGGMVVNQFADPPYLVTRPGSVGFDGTAPAALNLDDIRSAVLKLSSRTGS